MLFLLFNHNFCLKANPDIINKINIINKKGWAVSALLYVSYNMTLALVVLYHWEPIYKVKQLLDSFIWSRWTSGYGYFYVVHNCYKFLV